MRIVFKIIIFIVIIVIAGLIALPFIVDPNDYKQEISSQVEKATGRNLTLDGDIKLSVFPWIALELGPLSLSNAAGFKADSFAKVQQAEIRIKLMPLLKKQLEMDTIVLDGLVLNLEKNKAGKTNWDDLVANNDVTPDTTKKDNAPSDDGPALSAISIAGVKLTNANILWSDATTDQTYQLQDFNLNTDPLVPGEATALDMEFDVASSKPQAQAHVKLDSKVMVDLDNQHYKLTDLNLTTQASGEELPFSETNLTLSGDINADMLKQLVTIDDLKLTAQAKNNKQSINADLSAQVSSNLATQQSTVKALVLNAEVLDPTLPSGKANINLTADVTADMKQQTMILSALVIDAYDVLINGDIKASKLLSDNPNFVGNIIVKPFDLRKLANNLKIELPIMADDSTLEMVQLTTEFEASTKYFNAKLLDLTLDQSKLTGNLAINNFAKPAFDFKLNLDEIDADRYLPPASKTEDVKVTAQAPAETSAPAAENQLPLEALRQINAKGTIDIGKLTISGTHSEQIHVEINATNGLINLSPMSANMYQGQYQGNVGLDARGKTLKLSLNESLKGVKVGPLLKDLTGDDKLSGIANAQAKLTGNGATMMQIKQTLSGNGNFSFTDGAVKGVNIAESIRKAKAALKGDKLPASDSPVQTDFSNLSGSFTATNGIFDNQDLLAMSPLLRINGAGKIDLPREGIDYGLKVSIVETSSGQGGKELADLKGLTVPVKITGTFSNPKPSVDLASMLKEKATEEVKAKVADKLKDKLGGDLGGLLDGILDPKSADPKTDPKTDPATDAPADPAVEPVPQKTPEQELKDKLKGFF